MEEMLTRALLQLDNIQSKVAVVVVVKYGGEVGLWLWH